MDTQRQAGNDLAERIKATLAETQHRFELHDPFAEATYRLYTAAEAIAKADNLGASRFQYRSADGQVSQINKINSEWMRDDGKPLSDIQAEIDKNGATAIEARGEQRAAVGSIDAGTDKQMALADVYDFRRIQIAHWQESAAVQMAENARKYPGYKMALDNAIPGYPGLAEKVAALDAASSKKMWEKECRKASDMRSMHETRKETPPKTKDEIVAQMISEIISDMRSGRLPASISTFSELHDFVDGNCYGGFGDDDFADSMISHFGGSDGGEGMPQAYFDLINACQSEVHAWLVQRNNVAINHYKTEFPEFGELDVVLPEGFAFNSSSHDPCPCFDKTLGNERILRILIDYPDRSKSERSSVARFSLALYKADHDHIRHELSSNNWEEILEEIATIENNSESGHRPGQ